MFRNLRFYRVDAPWPDSEPELSERLAEAAFTPCGTLTETTAGWEPPVAGAGEFLCRRVGGADLLCLRQQSRILPPAAIQEVLAERVAAFESRMLRPPGARERRQLKEEVHGELLPKALLRSRRTRGFYLAPERVIAIDSATPSGAEQFIDRLRAALGSLPAAPLLFRRPLGDLLRRVFLGEAPAGLRAGRECRMLDPAAMGTSVHWVDVDLSDPDVRRHVRQGMKLDRLAVVHHETFQCVIDQDGAWRKIRLPGGDAAQTEDEEPLARLDADFALLTGSVRRLLETLQKALGGYA
jgi:recombination associated protein RdgC